MQKSHNYYAFISHRSNDKPFAVWLQKKIENYTVPKAIASAIGMKTKQVKNLCLDVASFSGSELKGEVDRKLEMSDKLLLICSKCSASPIPGKTDWTSYASSVDWLANPSENGWVGYEIVKYLETHTYKDIIPVVIDGDPIERDCFHPYLREHFIETDLLKWHDFREANKKDRKTLLRLIAAVLSIDNLDDFIKRDSTKTRVRRVMIGAAIALVIAAGIFCYDYFVPHTASYQDYVLVNGVPKGTTKAEKSGTAARYEITTTKFNKTVTLQHLNAHNIPTEDQADHHLEAPMIAKYKLRDSGGIDTVEYLDRNGVPTMTYAYTTDMQFVSFQENAFTSNQVYPAAMENEYGVPIRLKIDRYQLTYNEQGLLTKRMYMSGVNYVVDESGVAGETFTYDDKGRMTGIQYVNSAGQLVANLNGIAGIVMEYDENGNQTKKTYCRKDGSATYGPEYYAIRMDTYSENGLLSRTDFLDVNGQHLINADGYAIVKYDYNEAGDNITTSYFDTKEQPIFCLDGYHKTTCEYNSNGDVIRQSFFDSNDALIISKDDYAIVEKECDKAGNVTKISIYSEKGEPIFTENQSVTTRFKVDDKGCITEESHWDESGNPVLAKDGYSVKKVELDKNERPITIAFYGTEGEPVYNTAGYHKLQFAYDDRGNMIEVRALGLADQLIPFSGYWAIQKMAYNGGGYVTNVSYENQFGKPVVIPGGYASIENTYDDAGYLLSSSYFDAQGKLMVAASYNSFAGVVIADRFYATVKFDYDEHGNVIRETYLDEENELVNNRYTAYSIVEKTFDESGHNLTKTYFGPDGNYVQDDISRITYKYDEYGNVTETALYDAATNRPYESKGYTKIDEQYDAKRHLIRKAYYDAEDAAVGAIVEYEYDENGLMIAESYFTDNGKPFTISKGYAQITYQYDERHNLIETDFRDETGKLINGDRGYAIEIDTYDNRDNLIGIEYLNQNGEPTNHAGNGFARLEEDLNSWGNATGVRVFDKSGQLLVRYEAEYLNYAYRLSEAIYGPDGNLFTIPDNYYVAKCTYGYDDYFYRTEGFFYGTDGELMNLGNIEDLYAGYKSAYENGMEIERTYYGADGNPTTIQEGFASVRFIYDEYGREVRREFFDPDGKPVDTIFGFQTYEIEYSDTNEITSYSFLDQNGKEQNDIPGEVRIVTLALGGEVDTDLKTYGTQTNAVRVTRVAYYDEKGKADLMLTPQINLMSSFSVYMSKLTTAARKQIVFEAGEEELDLTAYGEDGKAWQSMMAKLCELTPKADADAFMEIYGMDFAKGTLSLLNQMTGANVSELEFMNFYKDFYQKSLKEYQQVLTEKYGQDVTVTYMVTGVEYYDKSEIDALNQTLTDYGMGDHVVEDFITLSVRFNCSGSNGEGVENDSFLYSQEPLMKIDGVWKIGQSDKQPRVDSNDLLGLFQQ